MASGGPCDRASFADQSAGVDPFYSTASWYRDYIAYCGVSDDGTKLFAIVAQLGRRKLILKKPLGPRARHSSRTRIRR
ncbi:MAG TPA: hypothetical protein VNY29_15295 [Terriglobales bacterium]|nr:hypothetical protein [Terriglobales bacterium]